MLIHRSVRRPDVGMSSVTTGFEYLGKDKLLKPFTKEGGGSYSGAGKPTLLSALG